MPANEFEPLDYAVETGPRRWGRWIFAAALLIAVAVSVFVLGPAVRRLVGTKIPFLRQQSKFMRWSFPSDGVAYTEFPAEAARLSAGRGSTTGCTTFDDQGRALAYNGDVPELGQFYDAGAGFGMGERGRGAIFLHSRRSAGHDARLVVVSFDGVWFVARHPPPMYRTSVIFWTVVRPASINTDPAILQHGGWSDPDFGFMTPPPVRVLFGQPDPVDESRFSFRVDEAGRPFVIHGQLMPDDTVTFKIVPVGMHH